VKEEHKYIRIHFSELSPFTWSTVRFCYASEATMTAFGEYGVSTARKSVVTFLYLKGRINSHRLSYVNVTAILKTGLLVLSVFTGVELRLSNGGNNID
jgi:hypothetical protein